MLLQYLGCPPLGQGMGNSSEDEEYVTLSTPVDTPASIQEEVVQSTIDEPDTNPSDLSSDVQTLPDHAASEHEHELLLGWSNKYKSSRDDGFNMRWPG